MSSVCPSDDLLMVRITGLVACAGAGLDACIVAAGFGTSTGKGFIALKILGWLGVAVGLLAVGEGTVGACAGFAGVFDAVLAGLVASAAILVFFGVAGAVALVTKYSCALKTFKQEPQRTAPLADCSWLGVTRKAVPHLGQRVIIWLLAEVMVYLLLTQGGPLKTRSIFYRYPTV